MSKHPINRPPAYNIWKKMRDRCDKATAANAKYYHDKGVSYDDRWKSYKLFFADMGSSYRPGLTLDRIDNTQGYSKDNCRWATVKEQANNKTTNVKLCLNGKTMTMAQWAEYLHIDRRTLWMRIHAGWSILEALTTPLRSYHG